jgi:hypothetical protein
VVELEADPARQEGEKGDNKEERDVEPSTATPIAEEVPRSLYLKHLILRDYKCPRNEPSLRTLWMCSSKSK